MSIFGSISGFISLMPPSSATTTDTAAASVGVNTPPNIPPNMTIGISSAAQPFAIALMSHFIENLFSVGRSIFLAKMNAVIIKNIPQKTPGIMDARYRSAIDTPAETP